jgi:hypothetical protein
VPPRLPKPRKRADALDHSQPPRSAIGPGSSLPPGLTASPKGRARGFSAPGAYSAISHPHQHQHQHPQQFATGWGAPSAAYSHHRALPPLTVPQDPMPSALGSYAQAAHTHALHPISPADDHAATGGFGLSYTQRGPDLLPPPAQSYASYGAPEPQAPSWSVAPSGAGSSLQSLLNHSHGAPPSYPPTRPTINTSYAAPSLAPALPHSASSLSPDSRPATGYSTGYDGEHYADYARRPLTPTSSRPSSSARSPYGASLSVRRPRRHSQAVAPYPPPYGHAHDTRPSSAHSEHDDAALARSRSMIQLPAVDAYGTYHAPQHQQHQHHQQQHQQHQQHQQQHAHEFAYAPPPQDHWGGRPLRPSTSASSLSGASQASSSAAHTPPVGDAAYAAETDIHRCE